MLVSSGEHAGQHAVKLFDGEIFADVAIGSGAQGGVHVVLVISHTGENDDWDGGINLTNESGQSDAIDLRHFQVDNDNLAVVMSEPSGGFEAVGEKFAGMSLLAEISGQESGDTGIVVDDQKLEGRSVWEVHAVL